MRIDLLEESPSLQVVPDLRQLDAHRVRAVPRLLQEPTRVDQDADERVAVFATGSTVRHGNDEERLLELVVAGRAEQQRLQHFLVEGLRVHIPSSETDSQPCGRQIPKAGVGRLVKGEKGLTVPSGVRPLNLIWLISEVASCSVLIPLPCESELLECQRRFRIFILMKRRGLIMDEEGRTEKEGEKS